jgi:hypothetical protein
MIPNSGYVFGLILREKFLNPHKYLMLKYFILLALVQLNEPLIETFILYLMDTVSLKQLIHLAHKIGEETNADYLS